MTEREKVFHEKSEERLPAGVPWYWEEEGLSSLNCNKTSTLWGTRMCHCSKSVVSHFPEHIGFRASRG